MLRSLSPLLLALLAAATTHAQAVSPDVMLDRAEAAMGSLGTILDRGGLTWSASGSLYQGAERQGLTPGGDEPSEFREALALASDGRLSYEYRHDRLDQSWEHIDETVLAPHDWVIAGPSEGWVVRFRDARFEETKRDRLLRRLPHALVAEARERDARAAPDGSPNALRYETSAGETITLRFDPDTGALRRAETIIDAPTFGDARIAWSFEDYRPVGSGVRLPRRYSVSLAGDAFTEMRLEHAALGPPDEALLGPPTGVALPDAMDAPPDLFDPTLRAAVRQVAPGVHVVTNLRQGFHSMFVEFDDFIIAIDAPAGYRLLNEFPPGFVAHGATSSSITERYIELIEEAAPGKPIRYVALTHFHNDHAGGLRAFLARGAAVIAPVAAVEPIRAMARAPHTINPDRYSELGAPEPTIIPVADEPYEITLGDQTLRLIPMGPNPHVRGMLVAHLPGPGLIFEADFTYPSRLESYPAAAHRETALFFQRWLDERGLDPVAVYSSHGALRLGPEHLEKLRRLGAEDSE